MRRSTINRKTNETDISLTINLDGSGTSSINTGIPFFDHMLTSFSKHSRIDFELKVVGDIEVDFHHTIEDTGITIGEALKKALGDKKGVERFGDASVPLDEALSIVALDLSGRSYLFFGVEFTRADDGSDVNPYLFEEFFRGLVSTAQMTLHIDTIRGNNSHHIIESIFKAFAKALQKALRVVNSEIPSTKGVL